MLPLSLLAHQLTLFVNTTPSFRAAIVLFCNAALPSCAAADPFCNTISSVVQLLTLVPHGPWDFCISAEEVRTFLLLTQCRSFESRNSPILLPIEHCNDTCTFQSSRSRLQTNYFEPLRCRVSSEQYIHKSSPIDNISSTLKWFFVHQALHLA